MARAKKTVETDTVQQDGAGGEPVIDNESTDMSDDGLASPISDGLVNGEPVFEPVAPIDMGLELQVTNHGDRCWVGVIKQWIEEGQSFLTFESESEKQRLIMTLVQLNMFANYDRFEWVG